MSWTVARWAAIPGLVHGFGSRTKEPPGEVRTLRQVHGARVIPVAEIGAERIEGDGLVSRPGDAPVGVHTADCVPILLVARRARIAAAVHSGWRGTVAGIAERAVALLAERWGVVPAEIEAALGPAIGGCCYEVGEEVRAAFRERYGGRGLVGFAERGPSLRLDLRRFLEDRLAEGGVAVESVGPCTACRTDVLHSYRRERGSGRQLSWIGWDDPSACGTAGAS